MNYVNMTEALRQVRETTCPKCEGESCECPQNENTLEITNADKMINSVAYQNYKSGTSSIPAAEDLEEQKKQLEEEIGFLSDMKNTMIQEKIQQGFAVRFFDPSNGKRFAAAYPNKKDAQDKAAQLKRDGLKDISITQHTLNFKEENLTEADNNRGTPSVVKQVVDKIKNELKISFVQFYPIYCQISIGSDDKNIIRKAADMVKSSSAKRFVFAVLPRSDYDAFRSAGIDGQVLGYSVGKAPSNQTKIFITNKDMTYSTDFGKKASAKTVATHKKFNTISLPTN